MLVLVCLVVCGEQGFGGPTGVTSSSSGNPYSSSEVNSGHLRTWPFECFWLGLALGMMLWLDPEMQKDVSRRRRLTPELVKRNHWDSYSAILAGAG